MGHKVELAFEVLDFWLLHRFHQ